MDFLKEISYEYKENGINVLPTKADKSPNIAHWQQLQTRMIETKEISQNFKTAHGIAMICGKISGGLEVLDFDNHQFDARIRFNEFMKIDEVKQICESHNLPIETTQGGGYHIFYRCSKIEGSQKLAQKPMFNKKNNKWRPDAIIETKGEGGYLICHPTPKYNLIRGDLMLIEEITPGERENLLNHAKTFNLWNNENKTDFENSEKPGDIYNCDFSSIKEAKQILLNSGWINIKNHLWRRPGKKNGISATFGKIAPNIFYNFSANGYPFEEKKAYTPFQILALLEFNGDFSATAKHLADKYSLKSVPKKEKKTEDKVQDYDEYLMEKIWNERRIEKTTIVKIPLPFLSIRKKAPEKGMTTFEPTPKFVRLFTAGNISVITGKAKSKKTFIQSMLVSALLGGAYSSTFEPNIDGKPYVFSFDTEQSKFDTKKVHNRIMKLSGNNDDNFLNFSLRGIEAKQLSQFIEYSIKKVLELSEKNFNLKNTIGMVFIDQVADLAKSINNEEEAISIVKNLEKLSNEYDLHFCCNVHQNKNDSFATGWLGSQLMKKAETIIKVTKDVTDNSISHVEPDLMRGEDFEPFSFQINSSGLPEIIQTIEKINTKSSF